MLLIPFIVSTINFLKIGDGRNILSIENNLPFKISELELNISSNNEETVVFPEPIPPVIPSLYIVLIHLTQIKTYIQILLSI